MWSRLLERYAEIIIPAAVHGTFSYALPESMAKVRPGMRVVVPFGKGRKLYAGLVLRIHDDEPEMPRLREVLSQLDDAPVVLEWQLLFWQRIAEHYLSALGEVMLAAMPGQLVLNSSTRITTGPKFAAFEAQDAKEAVLLLALEREMVLTLEQAAELLGVKDPMRRMHELVEEDVVTLVEHMQESFKPRTQRMVRLATANDEEQLHGWFDALDRAPKQLALLMKFVELTRTMALDQRTLPAALLVKHAEATPAQLKELERKGLFDLYERNAPLPAPGTDLTDAMPVLSTIQEKVLHELRKGVEEHGTALLHGVTGSGKTEVYIHMIQEALENGGQVLYLLPEIGLTTQLVGRLKARFGERVEVFHSRMSPNQRADLWMRMIREPKRSRLVLGVRSSLFLPFHALRLIVVDEEHDPSYKQNDPSPRYHARDMAVVMGELVGAKVVLGSATPSLESLFNVEKGKFGSAALLERYGGSTLPTVTTVDLRDTYKRKRMKGHFSPTLLEAIERAVARHEQVILFQNRRGYAPVLQCEQCAHVPECAHCDVSLTFHKRDNTLRCHYCGRSYIPTDHCPACQVGSMRMLGFGTERIEEELKEHLPTIRAARLDQDTARGRNAVEDILARLSDGELDVLVGTQMVTKGLDLERVSLVGIMNADRLWNFPDLRAHERAFQLMAQVAGRSGRRRDPGQVVIQAFDVAHPIIGHVLAHDTLGFVAREMEQRRIHGYPPFSRLVRFTFRHGQESRVAAAAFALLTRLRSHFGERALGPETPSVAWVKDKHIRNVLVKLRRSAHQIEKTIVANAFHELRSSEEHGRVRITVDVDPM